MKQRIYRKNLLKYARITRKWCEMYYTRTTFCSKNLCGMCAIASLHLYLLLRKNDYPAKIIEIDGDILGGHCYVICGKYMLDVTATQFSTKYPRILVQEILPCDKSQTKSAIWFWNDKDRKTFSTERAFLKHVKPNYEIAPLRKLIPR